MRLQKIKALLKTGVIVIGNSGMEMPTYSSCSAPRRMLGGRTNIGTLSELCRAHEIEYCDMIEEMLCLIKQNTVDNPQLPADLGELGLLPVERFTHLQIPVLTFRKLKFSNSTGPAALEQRLSATAGLEMIGYGSRLVVRRVMGICENRRWRDC